MRLCVTAHSIYVLVFGATCVPCCAQPVIPLTLKVVTSLCGLKSGHPIESLQLRQGREARCDFKEAVTRRASSNSATILRQSSALEDTVEGRALGVTVELGETGTISGKRSGRGKTGPVS